jgi:hypothetical protein
MAKQNLFASHLTAVVFFVVIGLHIDKEKGA